MKKSEFRTMTVTELRKFVREEDIQIPGAWKMRKDDLIEEIYITICEAYEIEDDETVEEVEEVQEVEIKEVEPVIEEIKEKKKNRGRTRTINVFKDDELIKTINGLIKTFEWAAENKICNQGWVKRSLKNKEDTLPGRKFKEGGYRFEYAD